MSQANKQNANLSAKIQTLLSTLVVYVFFTKSVA